MNPTPLVPAAPDDASRRSRLLRLWTRHRTLFWLLHSVWALATGILVIFLARERYGFLPWVAAFLVLTWASTMYFGHRTSPDATALPQGLMVLVRVFAPSAIPAHVTVEWKRDGVTVRTSDEISVVAHDAGFRIWDALRPGPEGVMPGRYRLILWTRGRRIFGVADIVVAPG